MLTDTTLEPVQRYLDRIVEQDADNYHIVDLLESSMIRRGDRIGTTFRVVPMTISRYDAGSGWEREALRAGDGAFVHCYRVEADNADFAGRGYFLGKREANAFAKRLRSERLAMTLADWGAADDLADAREAAFNSELEKMKAER